MDITNTFDVFTITRKVSESVLFENYWVARLVSHQNNVFAIADKTLRLIFFIKSQSNLQITIERSLEVGTLAEGKSNNNFPTKICQRHSIVSASNMGKLSL